MNGELFFVVYYGGMICLMGLLLNLLVKREYRINPHENQQSATVEQ